MMERYSKDERELCEEIHRFTELYRAQCRKSGADSDEAIAVLQQLEKKLTEFIERKRSGHTVFPGKIERD
jgi:hypothetical protein